MCSIFGFISTTADGPSLAILRDIVSANIHRGPHAFGFAWLDGRGRLQSYRQAGRLTTCLPQLRMLRDARILIGHLRYATHGEPANNINNHPHPVDGGWLVHNGVVRNYQQLAERPDLHLSSDCDSEAIARLIEISTASTLAGRYASAVRQTTGPLATLGLWARPATLILARRGNPLHWGHGDEGLYLGTLRDGLPGDVFAAPDNQLLRLCVRRGDLLSAATPLPTPRQSSAELFDRSTGGVYRGG